MHRCVWYWGTAAALCGLALLLAPAPVRAAAVVMNPAPTVADWTALGRLPDWTGTWQPDVMDWMKKARTERVPWTPEAGAQITALQKEEAEGHPRGIHNTCLPLGMPGSMMINFNLLEFLFTPGRITMLGETDGNILRRIYTDGRPHPAALELTFYGHSIGHWEGDTLVVDTVNIKPASELALGESVGIANGGGMHVVERFHLMGDNTLVDALAISAPKVLTAPWKTTRLFYRHRERSYDIVEGECLQDTVDKEDANGNAVFDTTFPPQSPP